MSRVTPEEVKEIISTELTDQVIQVWINSANSIVNANADCISGDEALLTQVELFLSCHFIVMVEPGIDKSNSGVKKEKAEGLETEYITSSLDGNINDTAYGKTANMLSGGCPLSTSLKAAKLFSLGGL